MKPIASISLDLDNLWAYLKVRGDLAWQDFPGYLETFTPLILDFLKHHNLTITFFLVGQDLVLEKNHLWLRQLSEAGHEFGNHSFHHEPWMQVETVEKIQEELQKTHEAIHKVTGKTPVGFRGPGFCLSPTLLEGVHALNYRFDASVLPSSLGPLARLYYRLRSPKLSKEEQQKRKILFGSLKNARLPLNPFIWQLNKGKLVEIPVTTIPILRFPFHLSYVIWLSQFSKSLALFYFSSALFLCRQFKVQPSFLLHPLDFFGKEDAPSLNFFPGMDLSREHKLEVAHRVFEELATHYTLLPMSEHADRISEEELVSRLVN